MKKISYICLTLALLLSFSVAFSLFGQEKKEADEVYTIKKGDTLWDISARFLKNPYLWPKLWQRNPYITNPHWIYPGNQVRLEPLEEHKKEQEKKEEAKAEEPRKAVTEEKAAIPLAKEPEPRKVEPQLETKTPEAAAEKKVEEEKPVFPEIRFAGFYSDINFRGVGYVLDSRGNEVAQKFFPTTNPVGKMLEIQGRPFEVIGVAKAQGSVFGQSRDNFVMVPIETYYKMFGTQSDVNFFAAAIDRDHIEQAQDEVRVLMRSVRHLKPKEEDNFAIVGSESLTEAWDRLTGAIAATAVAVVSVFMVVGGVVIMNIMLAVVTERTHEIGIRKSVGARKRDILSQFLVESSMLAASGGLIGVLTAWGLAILVRSVTPVPMSVPVSSVIIAVLLSGSVGLFFGIYPARRAAQLDPIEALRVEK